MLPFQRTSGAVCENSAWLMEFREGSKVWSKICLKNYHVPYEFMLDFFNIPSLQNRRSFLSLCTFYSILNNLVSFPRDCVLPSAMHYSRSRHYNPNAYRVPLVHCTGFKFSFFCNVVSVWNNLPTEAVTADNLPTFKKCISPLFLWP